MVIKEYILLPNSDHLPFEFRPAVLSCNPKSTLLHFVTMQDLPAPLKPISWLSGRWATKDGKGAYPNIPGFSYHEEIEFLCIGQPMFNFTSISRHPEKQSPMHQERGFLRIKPDSNNLAFVVSHNFGLTSLEEGTCNPESKEITLETVNLSRISFAKPPFVKKIKREIKLIQPNMLQIVTYMETDNTPLTEHLKAVYTKVSDD